MIRRIRGHFAPGLMYVIGLVSLFLLDLFISSRMSYGAASEWAGIKSFMMVVGPFLLLGFNNLFVRYPTRSKAILFSSLLGLNLTTVLMVGFCYYFLRNMFPVSYYVTAVLYALSIMLMSMLRGLMRITSAQVVQGLWKVVLLIMVAASYFLLSRNGSEVCVGLLVPMSMLVSVIAGVIAMHMQGFFSTVSQTEKLRQLISRDELLFSLKYLVSVVTAASSAYLEIFVVRMFCPAWVTAEYFAHYVIFTAIAILFSGYVGFVLPPAIRQSPDKYTKVLTRFSCKRLCLAGGFWLLSVLTSLITFKVIYSTRYDLNLSVALLMSACSMLQILYVFPTSFMGALACSEELSGFLVSGIVGIALMLLVMCVGYSLGNLMMFVVCASLLNWVWRTAAAYRYARRLSIFAVQTLP